MCLNHGEGKVVKKMELETSSDHHDGEEMRPYTEWVGRDQAGPQNCSVRMLLRRGVLCQG